MPLTQWVKSGPGVDKMGFGVNIAAKNAQKAQAGKAPKRHPKNSVAAPIMGVRKSGFGSGVLCSAAKIRRAALEIDTLSQSE